MSFVKKVWKNRIAEFPLRRSLINQVTGVTEVVDVQRNEGTIFETGDAFSAQNMNDLESRIEAACAKHYEEITQTLAITETTLTFTFEHETIGARTWIKHGESIHGVNPISITYTENTVTLIYPAQQVAVDVTVRIDNSNQYD